jgi:glutathione S-transferase
MLLYDFPASGNCFKVRLLFAHLGIRYERREVDPFDYARKRELLGDLNPSRRVPTVVLDDGRALPESNSILYYFAEGTDYLPADRYARAQVIQWLCFEQFNHQPHLSAARVWARGGKPPPPEERAARMRSGEAALRAMDRYLDDRRFLVEERYSIADIALYAYTHVAEEGGFDLGKHPAVRAWLDRVSAQPGYVPMMAPAGARAKSLGG